MVSLRPSANVTLNHIFHGFSDWGYGRQYSVSTHRSSIDPTVNGPSLPDGQTSRGSC